MNDVKNRSARAGTWLAAFGPETSVLVPAAQKSRIAGLWALVDDAAPFEVVLDALLAQGLGGIDDFVVVAASDSSARVLVRGSASASVHTATGTVEVTGQDRVWGEQSFTDVTALVLTLPDSAPTGPEVSLTQGLLRVGSVVWGTPGEIPVDDAVPGQGPVEVPAEPVAEPLAAEPLAPEPAAVPDLEAAAAAIPEVEPVPETASPAGPPAGPEPVVLTPAVAGLPPEADETGEHPALDHDGMTQTGAQPGPVPQPGIPGQPQAPSVTSRPVARLVFSHGTTAEVDRAILVGRAPEARRFTPGDQPQLITVPSPHQEVSSTHLEIRPGSGVDHGMAVVTDLGSTNGTLLVQPGLPQEDLQPGIAVSLMPGAILDLGDGVTIQVTQP
ncbi:FHA domain-containing protein [Nocardioides houyundeii]|uniref:FHA domain-containing protein n=1 Tax=Nocardioides houyundeii TaxID=2045452 RepID=UPI000DF178F1|nr:FHA domain-containing protein [Nocardioides houyundeii]